MEPFIGSICAFGFNYAPYGWSLCQGQILSISSNTALFSLLGTAYGGNGTSTFGLPNLSGRVAICQGTNMQSNYVMGESGGSDTVTLLSSNLPPHTHPVAVTLKANATGADGPNPGGSYPGTNSNSVAVYNPSPTTAKYMKQFTVTLGNTGGIAPIGIQDPGLVMNYCIAQYGVFPSRN